MLSTMSSDSFANLFIRRIAFGDALPKAQGNYLRDIEICRNILGQKLDKCWQAINNSTNGFTKVDLVRFLNPMLENYKRSYPSIIPVTIGTNDPHFSQELHILSLFNIMNAIRR